MITVLLILHMFVAIGLVGVVLLQRSEGGALGIGGGGGSGMSGFLTGRGTANLLTRATAVLAAVFLLTSLTLARIAGGERITRSITDEPSPPAADSPAPPVEPSAPIAR